MSGVPAFFRKSAARARRRGKIGRLVLKGLADDWFPYVYFLQNVLMLRKEAGWKRLPPRVQKERIRRMLCERASIFLAVKRDLASMRYGKPEYPEAPAAGGGPAAEEGASYCIHCGGCCEIASGLDDFPSESAMPPHWRRLFCDGLGKGHRFCPFLWEDTKKGRSLCPVHPWRSNPCRIFEREECDYFLNDPDYIEISNPNTLVIAGQWLAHLVDGR